MNGTRAIILLNQVAQGIRSLEQARQALEGEPEERQQLWRQEAGFMALSAGATSLDAFPAADWADVKRGSPAVVLFGKELPPKVQLAKILALPRTEHPRTFAFLLGLFFIADSRRRGQRCRGACSHWWHKDLSDADTVEQLVASNEACGWFLGR